MKIFVIASLYNRDFPSGENLFVRNLLETFDKYQIEFESYLVQTPNVPHSLYYKIKTGIIQLFNLGNSPRLKIEKYKPDILIVSNLFPNISSRWMKKIRIPIIYFQHNFRIGCVAGTYNRQGKPCFNCATKNYFEGIKFRCYRNSFSSSLIASLRLILARNKRIEIQYASTFIALQESAVGLLELAGIERSKIRVLSNFLPELQIETPPRSLDAWIYSGRLSVEKGILQLISIWPASEKLHIYGDGPLANQIRFTIRDKPNIEFRGLLENKQLQIRLRGYRGAVFPSTWKEGLPMVSLEYFRSGIPIIVSEGNVVAGLVEESRAGVVFNLYDAQSLSEGLLAITRNRLQFSNNAREYFKRFYSEEIWMKELIKIINEKLQETENQKLGHNEIF